MTEKIINPQRKLFFGLFVFPLIIAVGMAVILCGVVLLTSEEQTPETLISAIKSGTPSKRWQKAFELSNELNQNKKIGVRGEAVLNEIIYILKDSKDYDSQTRGYMAMALGHFPESSSIQALRNALQENSQEIQIAAMWSLGSLGAREASADIEKFLNSDQSDLRKVSVYILGILGDKNDVAKLRPLLADSVADVRWNAALALARLGDDSGYAVLVQMADRAQLAPMGMQEAQTEAVMINAIKGLALIRKPESIKIFELISHNDKNMKVRQAAIEAADYNKKLTA